MKSSLGTQALRHSGTGFALVLVVVLVLVVGFSVFGQVGNPPLRTTDGISTNNNTTILKINGSKLTTSGGLSTFTLSNGVLSGLTLSNAVLQCDSNGTITNVSIGATPIFSGDLGSAAYSNSTDFLQSGVNFFGSGGGVFTNYSTMYVVTNMVPGVVVTTNGAEIRVAVGTNTTAFYAGITNGAQNLQLGITTNLQSLTVAGTNAETTLLKVLGRARVTRTNSSPDVSEAASSALYVDQVFSGHGTPGVYQGGAIHFRNRKIAGATGTVHGASIQLAIHGGGSTNDESAVLFGDLSMSNNAAESGWFADLNAHGSTNAQGIFGIVMFGNNLNPVTLRRGSFGYGAFTVPGGGGGDMVNLSEITYPQDYAYAAGGYSGSRFSASNVGYQTVFFGVKNLEPWMNGTLPTSRAGTIFEGQNYVSYGLYLHDPFTNTADGVVVDSTGGNSSFGTTPIAGNKLTVGGNLFVMGGITNVGDTLVVGTATADKFVLTNSGLGLLRITNSTSPAITIPIVAGSNVTITDNATNIVIESSGSSTAYTNTFTGPNTTGSVTSASFNTNQLLRGDATWTDGNPVLGMLPLSNLRMVPAFTNAFTANTPVDVYTVPAGRRAYWNSYQVFNPSGATITCIPKAKIGGNYFAMDVAQNCTSSNTFGSSSTPGIVLEAGQSASFVVNTTGTFPLWTKIFEFGTNTALKSGIVTNWVNGDNIVYTCPAGKNAVPLPSNLLIGNSTTVFVSLNNSGGARVYKYYIVPSGSSPSSANQLFYSSPVDNTRANVGTAATLGAGDSMVINSDSSSTNQSAWVNVHEF